MQVVPPTHTVFDAVQKIRMQSEQPSVAKTVTAAYESRNAKSHGVTGVDPNAAVPKERVHSQLIGKA